MTVTAHLPPPVEAFRRARGPVVGYARAHPWHTAAALVAGYLALGYIALGLLAVLAVVTVELGRARWHGGGPERVAGRRTAALGTTVLVAGTGLTWLRWPVVVAGLCLLALHLLLEPEPEQTGRVLTHEKVARAMVKARIIAPPKDQTLPTLLWRGHKTGPEGETARICLGGVSHAKVTENRAPLAAALGLPDRLLVVTYDDDDPADVVTLFAGRRGLRESPPSPLAATARTTWTGPLRIGTDPQGREVTLTLPEQNTLVGGKPGYGKTSLVRLLLAHALLDPGTVLYGLDGKGSRADYAPLLPLAARWVWGTDEQAADELLAMLREVLTVVQARNATVDPPAWPLVLLLLEELQDVRSSATPEEQEQIDTLLGRVIRMGRAVAVHVVISTQRPSVEDVPSGVRNLVSQNLALVTRNAADAALILGLKPTSPLPARRGEALLVTPTGETPVLTDHLDLDGWKQVCARALALRAQPVVSLAKPEPDPLADAVRDVLGLLGPLRPSSLYDELPEHLRPRDVQALGYALRAMPGVIPTKIGPQKRPGYALDSRGGVVGAAPDSGGTTPGVDLTKPRTHGSETQDHAHLPPVTGRTVLLPALP